MHRKYFYIIVVITILSILFIVYSFESERTTPVVQENIIQPPQSPFQSYIYGLGVVEPKSGNIMIGTPVNGIVEKIFVEVGQHVNKGEVLFQLENKNLKAEMRVQEMAYRSAMARMHKLQLLPQPEDLLASQAILKAAETNLQEAKQQYQMVLDLSDPRTISKEEKDRRRFRYAQAQEKYNEVQAESAKVHAGTWKPDLEIAHFEALQAKASLAAIESEIERTNVKSPIDGTVLQVKVHEGEYAMGSSMSPVMVLGDINELYLRVNINQLEVAAYKPQAPAVAFLQGDSQHMFHLEFVREEPYLVPKSEITNQITETVDTRVFQVLYKIIEEDARIFTGERMDVFIDREVAP